MSVIATTIEAAAPSGDSTYGAASDASSVSVTQLSWGRDIPIARLDPWQVKALRDVLRVAALPYDWDSYKSPPPKRNAVAAAIILIVNTGLGDLPAPHVVPVSGGGVQLEWRAGTREVELNVLPSGSVEYLKSEGDEPVQEGTLHVFDATFLHALFAWLMSGRRLG